MTITFTKEEWERHVAAIDKWRFEREALMERILKEEFKSDDVMGPDKADELLGKYNAARGDEKYRLESPIAGTKLNVS